MKTIFDSNGAKLTVGAGTVILDIHAWGHTSSIKTEIWEQLVQAWLRMRYTTPAGEVWMVSKDRLALFLAEAERASMTLDGAVKFVRLRKVKELLFNLASGRAPDEAHPPSWAGKDCVGALRHRGWKITDDGEGLQRRGFFIPGKVLLEMNYVGGVESTADMLEIEHAQRTDREDKQPDPHRQRHQTLAQRPANGCIDCRHQQHGFCTLSDETRDVKVWVEADKLPGSPQVVPDWCPLVKRPEDCPYCANNSGCNYCNPGGELPR